MPMEVDLASGAVGNGDFLTATELNAVQMLSGYNSEVRVVLSDIFRLLAVIDICYCVEPGKSCPHCFWVCHCHHCTWQTELTLIHKVPKTRRSISGTSISRQMI